MSTNLVNYVPSVPPILPESGPVHYQRELEKIRRTLDTLAEGLRELSAEVATLNGGNNLIT